VPDEKRAKNRVHLDLRTRDLEPEALRLTALGARVLTACSRSASTGGDGTFSPIRTATSSASCNHRLATGQDSRSSSTGPAGLGHIAACACVGDGCSAVELRKADVDAADVHPAVAHLVAAGRDLMQTHS
jgi:hypothetical protein